MSSAFAYQCAFASSTLVLSPALAAARRSAAVKMWTKQPGQLIAGCTAMGMSRRELSS